MNLKKTSITLAIITGVGLFGYALYRYFKVQADLLRNFTYEVIDFGIKRLDLQLVKGELSILFTSKSDIEVVIEKFIVDFYLNGVNIGYVEDKEKFVIPSKASTIIPFSYTLDPQVVMSNVTKIISGAIEAKDQVFEVKGFAKIKSGFIRVSLPIEYKTTLSQIMLSY